MTAEQVEAKKSRVAEAPRLHDEGLSTKQTAERMGVAHETVRRCLRANGIPFVKKPTNKGTRKLPCGSFKYCPSPMIDHIVPLGKGGPHLWDNVQIACAGRNIARGGVGPLTPQARPPHPVARACPAA